MAQRHRQGLTLLELVIATAILAIGLVGIVEVYSRGIRAAGESEGMMIASLIARQKLAEFDEMPELEPDSEDGDVSEPYETYSWQTEVDEVPDREYLYRIRIVITWNERDQPRELEFETILFKPPEEEEEELEEEPEEELPGDGGDTSFGGPSGFGGSDFGGADFGAPGDFGGMGAVDFGGGGGR